MTQKQEVEVLMNSAIGFAKGMLRAHGGVHPYGAYLANDGSIVDVGADTGTDHPPAQEVLHLLKRELSNRASRGELRACALVFDVRIEPRGEASDAIQVNLEHIAGYCAEVFFPYRRREDGQVDYFSIYAQQGSREIFAQASA